MFNAPYFDGGYFPDKYFAKPLPFNPANPAGSYFPAWYFGPRNAPGNFWIVGVGATPIPPRPPSPDGGGGGALSKGLSADQIHYLRQKKITEAQIHAEDDLVVDFVIQFLSRTQ